MTWPLGYAAPSFRFESGSDGTIAADGVRITYAGGWLDVEMPPAVRVSGGPAAVSLRITLGYDDRGAALLIAEVIACGGRRYTNLSEFVRDVPETFVTAVVPALHASIARKVQASSRVARATRPAPIESSAQGRVS